VKQFINEDIPLFHNVEFVRKPGAPPLLHTLNAEGKRVETIDLEPLNREQCNQELIMRGFYKKSTPTEPVPDEFKTGPYVPRTEL
jgi:hypothetical protein